MAIETILDDIPAEKGTLKITVSFTDENGNAVTPKTLTKTLTDSSGTVINSISAIVVTGLASSKTFILSGNDLQIPTGNADLQRHFLLQGTYDSTNGNDLPLKILIIFSIKNLVAVT